MKKKISKIVLGAIMALTLMVSSNSNALLDCAKLDPGTPPPLRSSIFYVTDPGTPPPL